MPLGQIHPRPGPVLGRDAVGGVDDHPGPGREAVPPVLRITEAAGPIGRRAWLVRLEHALFGEVDRVEDLRRPEHVGLRVVPLGPEAIGQAGCLGLLGVADRVDADSRLALEGRHDLARDVVVGGDIEDDTRLR